MGFFNIKKDKRDEEFVPIPDENGHIIQMIEGEVIDVGSEVTGEINEDTEQISSKRKRKRISGQNKPKVFSYRYRFVHPVTKEIIKAYDDLPTVEIGEQIYDIGEKVPLIFSDIPNKSTGNNYSVTRKIIFPEIMNKKKKMIRFFKIIYLIVFFALIFLCMCYNIGKQPVENNAETTPTVTTTPVIE